jgi:hypothetical protein
MTTYDRNQTREILRQHLRYVSMAPEGLMTEHARLWLAQDDLLYFTFYVI